MLTFCLIDFQGHWEDDQKHGSGKYIYARHGEIISGTWEKGRLVGRVVLKCSKFSYEGKWDSEGPIGDGKFKLPKVSQLGGYTRELRKSNQFFLIPIYLLFLAFHPSI